MRFAVVLALVGLAGCGSRFSNDTTPSADVGEDTADTASDSTAIDTGGGDSDGEVATEQTAVCDAVVSAACNVATEKCCKTISMSFDAAGCETFYRARCEARWKRVAAGTSTFNTALLADCVAAIRRERELCNVPFLDYIRSERTCARMFNGTTAVGGACSEHDDCKSTETEWAYCGTTSKKCVTYGVSTEGAYCGEEPNRVVLCPVGNVCDGTGLAGTCRKGIDLGAACTTATSCGFARSCREGSCQEGLPATSACAADTDCASWRCISAACTSPTVPMPGQTVCKGKTGP